MVISIIIVPTYGFHSFFITQIIPSNQQYVLIMTILSKEHIMCVLGLKRADTC